jgi:hypothetical protein
MVVHVTVKKGWIDLISTVDVGLITVDVGLIKPTTTVRCIVAVIVAVKKGRYLSVENVQCLVTPLASLLGGSGFRV